MTPQTPVSARTGAHALGCGALAAAARCPPAERHVQELEAECDRLRRDLRDARGDSDSWRTLAAAREREIALLRGQLEAGAGAICPIPAQAGRRLQGRCVEDGCDAERELRKDGLMRIHKHRGRNCPGARRPPRPGTVRPLSEGAMHHG